MLKNNFINDFGWLLESKHIINLWAKISGVRAYWTPNNRYYATTLYKIIRMYPWYFNMINYS